MDLQILSNTVGEVLFEKGVIGHVTVDLISFPNPQNKEGHPLFQAVDINCHLTDYAAATFNFDLLMEGKLERQTGQYFVEVEREPEDITEKEIVERAREEGGEIYEPRNFMFCRFLHHPGLATIQFSTFFHMCRLEGISYEMEKRTGSTFQLFDCLQGGVLGLMTIGEDRQTTVTYMIEALNFIQNQAGLVPSKGAPEPESEAVDDLSISDVFQRVKAIYRAF